MTTPKDEKLTAKGRATRERIVASSAALIFAEGEGRVSLDDVRADAKASKSQLYHYFADKAALLQAVIDFQGERVLGFQEPALRQVEHLSDLRQWRDLVVDLAETWGTIGGCPIGALASAIGGADSAQAEAAHGAALRVYFDRWRAAIEGALRRLAANSELRPEADPAALAETFLLTIQGGLLLAKVRGSSAALAHSLDALITLVAVEEHGA